MSPFVHDIDIDILENDNIHTYVKGVQDDQGRVLMPGGRTYDGKGWQVELREGGELTARNLPALARKLAKHYLSGKRVEVSIDNEVGSNPPSRIFVVQP